MKMAQVFSQGNFNAVTVVNHQMQDISRVWSDFIIVLKDFRLLNVFCLEDVQVYKHQVQKKIFLKVSKKIELII